MRTSTAWNLDHGSNRCCALKPNTGALGLFGTGHCGYSLRPESNRMRFEVARSKGRQHGIPYSETTARVGWSFGVSPSRLATSQSPSERMARCGDGQCWKGTGLCPFTAPLSSIGGPSTSHAPDVFHLAESGVPMAALYGAWLTDELRDIWRLRRHYPNHQDAVARGSSDVPVPPPLEHHLPAGFGDDQSARS